MKASAERAISPMGYPTVQLIEVQPAPTGVGRLRQVLVFPGVFPKTDTKVSSTGATTRGILCPSVGSAMPASGPTLESGGDEVRRVRRCLDQLVRVVASCEARLADGETASVDALLREVLEAFASPLSSLRAIIDTMPALAWTARPDGGADFFSKRYLDYTGLSSDEAKEWGWSGSLHPDDLEALSAAWRQALSGQDATQAEARIRRHDGEYRWFLFRATPLRNGQGEVIKWCGTNTDIDDLKRTQDALQASERGLTQIVNTIPTTAWATRPDGFCEFLNSRWLDYAGFTTEQARGWGWSAAVHPDDAARLLDYWQGCLASGTPVDTEARLRRFDGVYRRFIFRANPLRDESGQIIRWYGTNIDIEDRKQAETQLNSARAELAVVSRVTTLGALSASIAHEINQPLTGIVTNSSTCLRMLQADPPNIAGALETTRRTIRDSHRAAEVIARLRELYSKKEFTLASVDLNEMTREVVALSSSELQRNNVVVETELTDKLPHVIGDRVQLQQVLLNLLRNAADAMSGVADRPRRLTIKTEADGDDRVKAGVRDVGVGVDQASVDKLFTAFYTTKNGSMGIGLSVSRSIVERHQGRLWAEPNDGPGATFWFSIPLEPAPIGGNLLPTESSS